MNWRLDHPPVVDVSISRHMGLYAVSRLAARHGIRVKLRPGAPQGLSALVWLPGTLAKREAGATVGGPPRPFTIDATGPAAGIRPAAGARPVTGRHRGGLTVGGGEPALAGAATGYASQSGQAGQTTRTSAWFAAKKPSSSGTAVAEEELATNWQTTTGWQAAAARQATVSRPATAGWEAPAGFGAPPRNADLEEPGAQTNTGLPRRVPRTSAFPGSDTPGSGLPGMVPAGPVPTGAGADLGAPVLGAPPGGTGPQGLPRREPRSADARPQETRSPEAPHQDQGPSRRRSPDAARSRLSGFQLGSRDAVQTGQTSGWKPFGGEENSR